jgi:ADP-ribose pyrophosphatase YjhB (NUDIX family)
LPGGGLDFGEHPQVGALRELTEETGYLGEIDALLGVDVEHFVGVTGVDWHAVRIIYRARVVGGELTHEHAGTTDQAAWVSRDGVPDLDAVPLVAAGRSLAELPGWPVGPAARVPVPTSALPRAARVAAYALLRDEADRVLLVRAGPGTTWAGRWILPGGGAEHGEDVVATVVREVAEETGLTVTVQPVVAVASDVVESLPRQEQLWTVRLVCAGNVVAGTLRPEVDGSSDDVRWFTVEELAKVPVVPFVREVLAAR